MLTERQTNKRTARQSRQQLVCILADNSGSMRGAKSRAATEGIREMLLRCQTMGPRGPARSYFRLVLIQFGDEAQVVCNMTPVRQIDPDSIEVRGDGGGTNITAALELAYEGLERYVRTVLEPHPERREHPLPVVLLFSDGHNGYGKPEPMAERIKALEVDGESVVVACAGVSTSADDDPDEQLLRAIASDAGCYLDIRETVMLSAFLAEVGSSGASSPREVAQVIQRLTCTRGVED